MGTMASMAVAADDVNRLGEDRTQSVLAAARSLLEELDHRFSHYSDDSEISAWQAGDHLPEQSRAEIDHVLARCADLARDSHGVFSATDPRTGSLDTAGFVKGYAIARASGLLREHGAGNHVVGVGGDVQCSGRASADRPWRVAVQDPARSHAVLAMIDATDVGVATSGRAERGDHIWSVSWDNVSSVDESAPASFTVVGPSIEFADAYATIGFAMGERGLDWVAQHEGYRSVLVRGDGTITADAALVSPV